MRTRRVATRELLAEASAGALFLACAGTLAVVAGQLEATPGALAALLVALLAIVSRVKFPIGVGFVVPTPLVLVPMLLLLPPAAVPLLVAAGLVLGSTCSWLRHRAHPERTSVFEIRQTLSCGDEIVRPQVSCSHIPPVS